MDLRAEHGEHDRCERCYDDPAGRGRVVGVLVERVLERVESDDEPGRDGGQGELARHVRSSEGCRVELLEEEGAIWSRQTSRGVVEEGPRRLCAGWTPACPSGGGQRGSRSKWALGQSEPRNVQRAPRTRQAPTCPPAFGAKCARERALPSAFPRRVAGGRATWLSVSSGAEECW